jgi:mannose-6-phosphate isomerase-like protein (cupin superfamily)
MFKVDLSNLPKLHDDYGGYRQSHRGENVSLRVAHIPAGRPASPAHSHANEQIVVVLEGSYVLRIGDEEVPVKAGDVLVIPPDVPHGSVKVFVDSVVVDIFAPPQET